MSRRIPCVLLALCLFLLANTMVEADSVIRVASWNTLNRPNLGQTEPEAAFTTVFQAMGAERVDGIARAIDILAVQETDPESFDLLTALMNQAYGVESYGRVVSSSDRGHDRTGFIYNNATVNLVGDPVDLPGDPVKNMIPTHSTPRAEFRPVGFGEEFNLVMYSVQLKSGDGAVEMNMREDEVNLIRDNADALGEGVNVIYAGDFNMRGSSEAAWANMTAAGPGQGSDLANAPGDWRDNPAFLSLHTQDPREGKAMDDRFDLAFASGELLDGLGLDYMDDSFHVFGNNGTHELNMPIATGSGASLEVLTALTLASDHLPIVFQLNAAGEPTADLTGNGLVDFEDLTVLLAHWNKPGATFAEGNLVETNSTSVDFADLTALLADWTGPAQAPSPEAATIAQAVPEPSSLILSTAILALLVAARSRSRRKEAHDQVMARGIERREIARDERDRCEDASACGDR